MDEADLRVRSEETTAALSGDGNKARAGQWVRTPKGWSGVLLQCPDFDDVLEWLELFAGTWPHRDEKIIGGPRSRSASTAMLPSSPGLMTYLLMSLPDLTQMSRSEREIGWHVDAGTTRYLAEQGLAWQHIVRGTNWMNRSDWEVETVGLDHTEAIAEAAQEYGPVRLLSIRDSLAQRKFELRPPGNACAYSGPDADWRTTLDRHRDILTWTPPRTQYGCVRHSHFGGGPSGQSWPHIYESDLRYHRPLIDTYVPDASGLQVLTDAHLERANDLTDWDITPLTGGRHLVATRDVEGWFRPPAGPDWGPGSAMRPAPENEALVAKARADFGEMILTPQVIKDHNPWPNWPK
ncbi:hypothetical protein [Nocardioides sp.]|uniref:hypothetical protein n=1 Tax=Nocardioides sp. TaxID=35761 RepID=UPI002C3FE800|nr:hypothetical protein [Nocardioides sp.]HXH80550.1 hypothetical protein [Nocardioides sp.]